jgi:hypothetical protein
MKRIVIGALVGGMVVFIWGAISHMVLPLGEMGLKSLPNEAAVIEGLKAGIPDEGLYFYPGIDMKSASAEDQTAWEAKIRSGPTGMVLYHPNGGEPLSPKQLASELLTNILAATLAACLASMMTGSYGRRVFGIAHLGLFAWLSISVSYWIWYGFPGSFIVAEGIDQFVSWALAGLVIAKIVPAAMK